jgi:hypothetical protein
MDQALSFCLCYLRRESLSECFLPHFDEALNVFGGEGHGEKVAKEKEYRTVLRMHVAFISSSSPGNTASCAPGSVD